MTNFLATIPETGQLKKIPNCSLILPFEVIGTNSNEITFYSLPEISESKSATYPDEELMGRSSPINIYSKSDHRSISITMHLYVTVQEEIEINLNIIRAISSLVYPEYSDEDWRPPNIVYFNCGKLLSENRVPLLLKDYNVNYATDVQWFYDEEKNIYMPLHVSIKTSWNIVYSWESLPGWQDVIKGNY